MIKCKCRYGIWSIVAVLPPDFGLKPAFSVSPLSSRRICDMMQKEFPI